MHKLRSAAITFLFLIFLLTFVRFSESVIPPVKVVGADLSKIDLGVGYNMECLKTDSKDMHPKPDKDGDIPMFTPDPIEPVTYIEGGCNDPTRECELAVCGGGASAKGCRTQNPEVNAVYFPAPVANLARATVQNESEGGYRTSMKAGYRIPAGKTLPGQIVGAGEHNVYSVYTISPATVTTNPVTDNGAGVEVGSENGLKQATLEFSIDTFTLTQSGVKERCMGVFWDPYGRVFDAVSLEPFAKGEALVEILDEQGGYVDIPSNKSIIDELGKYNIYLKDDGYYKLNVGQLSSHEFAKVSLDPKYKDLYYKIHMPGDPAFYEKAAAPQRIDLPVKSKGAPYQRPIEYIFKDQKMIFDSGKEYALINFRVTHPLTVVKTNVVGEKVTCAETNKNNTNKDGFCTLVISAAAYPQDGLKIQLIKDIKYYMYGEKVEEEDYEIKGGMPVNTKSSTTMAFNPIFRSIDGFARDSRGQIIPNATVRIRFQLDGKIFTQIKADEKGYFTINRQNIPPLEYYLEFVDPRSSASVVQSTTEFAKSNKMYIESKKINMMEAQKNGKPAKMSIKEYTRRTTQNARTPQETTTPSTAQSRSGAVNGQVLVIIGVLFLLALLTGGAFYFYSKGNNSPY